MVTKSVWFPIEFRFIIDGLHIDWPKLIMIYLFLHFIMIKWMSTKSLCRDFRLIIDCLANIFLIDNKFILFELVNGKTDFQSTEKQIDYTQY